MHHCALISVPYVGTGRLRLARELPQKRRPTEVSALIIGSADAIGWQIPIYKVDLGLHCGCRRHPQIDRARDLWLCAYQKDFHKGE